LLIRRNGILSKKEKKKWQKHEKSRLYLSNYYKYNNTLAFIEKKSFA